MNIDDVVDVGKAAAIAIGGGSVWVVNGGERTISEIDPQTNQVVNTISTHYYPHSLAYGHGFPWVFSRLRARVASAESERRARARVRPLPLYVRSPTRSVSSRG